MSSPTVEAVSDPASVAAFTAPTSPRTTTDTRPSPTSSRETIDTLAALTIASAAAWPTPIPSPWLSASGLPFDRDSLGARPLARERREHRARAEHEPCPGARGLLDLALGDRAAGDPDRAVRGGGRRGRTGAAER